MRILLQIIFLFISFSIIAQDGTSIEKVVKADFDENGIEDIAYLTQETASDYDSLQIEVHLMGSEGILHEIKTEKMIFNKTNSDDYLLCYSFTFSENSLNLVFRKNNTHYYWFFEYNENDFELLYYGESIRENDTQTFRYLNLKSGKLSVSQLKPNADNWDTFSKPFTVISIPPLKEFKGYEVKWPK
jgi:hypothetical protein